MSVGKMPIANGLLGEDQFNGEPFFDLGLGLLTLKIHRLLGVDK